MEWSDLVGAALRELGADEKMVPGAMLRQRMEVMGARSGFDVGGYVADSPDPFAQLVGRVEGVEIKRRPGSDVLVGFVGASAPDPVRHSTYRTRPGALRKDVFQAFTRVEAVPFVYMPDADRFAPEDRSEGTVVEVERISLKTLIDDRRTFVNTLPEESQKTLLDALERSTKPLETFREAVAAQGVVGQWASRQAEIVKARVLSWARKHDVAPRETWFQQRREVSAHRTLERLLPYLTPDEIRAFSIPFRAIEAFLSDERFR